MPKKKIPTAVNLTHVRPRKTLSSTGLEVLLGPPTALEELVPVSRLFSSFPFSHFAPIVIQHEGRLVVPRTAFHPSCVAYRCI